MKIFPKCWKLMNCEFICIIFLRFSTKCLSGKWRSLTLNGITTHFHLQPIDAISSSICGRMKAWKEPPDRWKQLVRCLGQKNRVSPPEIHAIDAIFICHMKTQVRKQVMASPRLRDFPWFMEQFFCYGAFEVRVTRVFSQNATAMHPPLLRWRSIGWRTKGFQIAADGAWTDWDRGKRCATTATERGRPPRSSVTWHSPVHFKSDSCSYDILRSISVQQWFSVLISSTCKSW